MVNTFLPEASYLPGCEAVDPKRGRNEEVKRKKDLLVQLTLQFALLVFSWLTL
jgi:hypothetical protein